MPDVTLFQLSNVAHFLCYFIIGRTIKIYICENPLKKLNKGLVLLIVGTLSTIWIYLLTIPALPCVTFLCSLDGILVFACCTQFQLFTRFFKRFGKYSLQLYLLNGYLLVISRTIIVNRLGVSNPVEIICFNMLVDFFISYLIIKYIISKNILLRRITGIV